MKHKYIILVIVLAVVMVSCDPSNDDKNKTSTDVNVEKMDKPIFDEDSAFYFVEKQVLFGTRVPGSKAHAECAKWLVEKMKEYADEVVVQDFKAKVYNGKVFDGKNIISSFNPDNKNRILLGAHWDTRPYADHDLNPENHKTPIDGANDGASGVGVLIEIARQLSIKRPQLGIDIIFFDIEDYGEPQGVQSELEDSWCLGSQHWSKNPHKAFYTARYGILLDMVGGMKAEFAREGTSMYYAPDIVNKVWNIATELGYSNFFTPRLSPSIIDDHMYVNKYARIPMINIVEYNAQSNSYFNARWHTLEDNMDGIDKRTLLVVGEVVLATIYNEK
ncbi:MAG: M28 family peptidase [Bacteroidales bacterium]|nr:M28 family peptidase [Bacteroidales bacterium]